MYRSPSSRWVDPRCTVLEMPNGVIGPFVELVDGRILTVKDNTVLASASDGKSWSEVGQVYQGPEPAVPSGGLILRTHNDEPIMVYVDTSSFRWAWDDSTRPPAANIRSNVWTIRSLDGGRTWVDRQMIIEGFNGALICMIETGGGKVVVPVQMLVYDPGRHAPRRSLRATTARPGRGATS